MKPDRANIYSKLAATGIFISVLYIAWLLLVAPYLNLWEDRIGAVELLQKKHTTLSLIIKNKDEIDQQYQAISNNRELRQVFLNNKTGALADVKLQRIIKQVIEKSDGKLIQALIKTTKTTNKDNRNLQATGDKSVTVSVLMQGSMKSIYTALHQLENSRPLILVSNLEIIHNKSRYQISNTGEIINYRARYDATAFII